MQWASMGEAQSSAWQPEFVKNKVCVEEPENKTKTVSYRKTVDGELKKQIVICSREENVQTWTAKKAMVLHLMYICYFRTMEAEVRQRGFWKSADRVIGSVRAFKSFQSHSLALCE